ITLGGVSAGGNYTVSLSGAPSFRITPAVLTVTATAGQSKVYGDLDPALAYTATGFKAGDTAALLTGSLTRAAGENAGDYGITLGGVSAGGNYTVSLSGAPSFRITPAVLTVTATAGQAKVYGDLDPALAYTATGFKAGDTAALLTGSLTRAAGENAGDYGITLGGVSAGGNYTVSLSGLPSFRITPAALTVTATAGQAKVYGDLDPALAYTATGFKAGDTAALLTGALARAAGESAGDYGITLGGVSAGGNYTVSLSGSPSFRVVPVALTVTAVAEIRGYGDANPALSYAITGGALVSGDALTGALGTAATTVSGVGRYAIEQGSLAASANYSLVYVGADLTVTARALTVTAADAEKRYGTVANLADYTVDGLINGDTVTAVRFDSAGAGAAAGAGVYAVRLAAASGQGLANYTIVYVEGTLTVERAPLTVTANDAERRIGEADPVFTARYDGFVGGEGTEVLLGDLVFSTAAEARSAPGAYAIRPGGVAAANYDVSFVEGRLTVLEALPDFARIETYQARDIPPRLRQPDALPATGAFGLLGAGSVQIEVVGERLAANPYFQMLGASFAGQGAKPGPAASAQP
ncbi:MBG-2 domain-containing protein, partial [Zavarzinia compransoris]